MGTVGTIGGWATRALARLLAGGALAGVMAAPAWGQDAAAPPAANGAAATVTLAIPAGPLAGALSRFAEASGYQLLYSSVLVEGKMSAGVTGAVTVADGLSRLLAGTGLTFRVRSGRTIQIEPAVAADDERVTGAVRVEGVDSPWFGGAGQAAGVNGVNGSRDITATEGTKSFTSGALTIGSKAPQAIKDVPQSVSVLTSERMQQQGVTDYTQALRQLPGVTLEQTGDSITNTFYSRGFQIDSIQIDGGAPLTTSTRGFFPQIDMSVYDHVELLRGAATFNGYGNPGGTINLVRKKPLDHAQYTIEAQAGSWSNYRLVADATSPLAFDGKLRARLITTYQNRHFFYDDAKDDRTLVYGIAELDATPTTLLTAGIQHTRQHSVPWYGGMPRYLNGGDLGLPRSTSFVFPWNRWDFTTTEIFGAAEQKLGGEWTARLNVTSNRQRSTAKWGRSIYPVNPTNLLGPVFSSDYDNYSSKQLSAEAVVNGAFTLFGQRQEVTAGVSRTHSDFGGLTYYQFPLNDSTETSPYIPYPGGPAYYYGSPNGEGPPINVFDFDPSNPLYNEPANPLANYRTPVSKTVQTVAYANLRLTAFDRLHLAAGVRWNRSDYTDRSQDLCTDLTTSDCEGLQIGDVYDETRDSYADSNFSWPPTITASVDLTRSLNAYVGYTDIYESQANNLTADNKPLLPATGSNWEAGLKWAPHNGKLNLSLSVYDIRKKGFAILVGDYEDLGGGRSCCYVSDPDAVEISRGVDAEATGQILPGWQIATGYTYNENRTEGEDRYGSNAGLPRVSIQPKHLYKLWMSYDFGAAGKAGAWSRLSVSGGINGQSSGYNTGTTCIILRGTPDPVTGEQRCASRVDYKFTVPGYAIVSARIDYRVSKAWSLAINFDNILDKTYYQSVNNVNGGNWYGAPRSALFTLRGKW